MAFDILKNLIKPFEFKPLPPPIPKPEPKPEPKPFVNPDVAKKADVQTVAANKRLELEKKLPPTPTAALDKINQLPKPDPTDAAAVKSYKEQRAKIADDAIKNSVPPKIEDYRNSGLNGATANYEYQQSKSYYDSQVGSLKKISDEAKRNPTKIISPYEAVTAIDKLPKPDRSDPNAIKAYNDKKAQIANDALMYATPPNREDYLKSGLNGATANYEYEQAKTYYDSAVKQLKETAYFEGLTTLLTPEADKAATEAAGRLSGYIEDNGLGGLDGLNDKIASEISDLKLKYGDEAAAKMMAELYKKNPDDLFTSLRLADKMSDYDKQNIGKALGDGYGYLSAEERAEFAKAIAYTTVGDSFTTNVNFGKSTTLAELLAHSSNTQMKTDVVKAMMDLAGTIKAGALGDNGGVDVQALFKSAAMIADTAPPAERAAMLKNIIETLPKINLPSLIKDNETKDLLSKLFMNSGPEFMHLVAPDGSMSKEEKDALVKFMELTVFSEGNNSLRPQMMAYMVQLTKDVGDAATIPPIPNTEYAKTHGGWSKEAHVEVMGGFMAVMCKAAENQKDAIKSDQEQQKKTVQMFTGLAFSFVPGAGKALGDISGEGAVFLEKIAVKVTEFAWDKAKGAAQTGVEDGINKLLSDDSLKNIDTMLSTLTSTASNLNESLPNGDNLGPDGQPDGSGNVNLRVVFQAAFAYYKLI